MTIQNLFRLRANTYTQTQKDKITNVIVETKEFNNLSVEDMKSLIVEHDFHNMLWYAFVEGTNISIEQKFQLACDLEVNCFDKFQLMTIWNAIANNAEFQTLPLAEITKIANKYLFLDFCKALCGRLDFSLEDAYRLMNKLHPNVKHQCLNTIYGRKDFPLQEAIKLLEGKQHLILIDNICGRLDYPLESAIIIATQIDKKHTYRCFYQICMREDFKTTDVRILVELAKQYNIANDNYWQEICMREDLTIEYAQEIIDYKGLTFFCEHFEQNYFN